ncbi:MAG: hypothetical protein KIS92_12505 [Planctomycetota bacterium]|nr:hypothetical protein [Planctomycetota bacterium]
MVECRTVRSGLLALALAAWACAGAEGPAAVPLRNELPAEGPVVRLTPRFGLHYHPGAVLALEGILQPALEPVHGITIQEGTSENGPCYVVRQRFAPDSPSNFRIPLRAPKGGAQLTLRAWTQPPGSSHERNVFVASLANHLKPVGRNEKIVLQLGRSPAPAPPDWHVSTVGPEQMPEEAWMYDNLDLVVVASAGLDACSERARQRLRAWVAGGGRVLVASLDPRAIQEAVRAGLTPLPSATKELQRDFDWWSRNANLKESDVVRDKNGSLVFAQYRLGLGGGVLFFQNADTQTLFTYWPKALECRALASERALADERIWGAPFDFFPTGTIAPSRRSQGLYWAGIGGLCLIFLLWLSTTIKTRYMAAGTALLGVAFFSAFLSHAFKAPEGVVTRVDVTEYPLDGRASRHTELAYIDGLQDASSMSVRGPEDGSLAELHAQENELAGAGTDLEQAGALRILFRPPCPAPLPPLFRSTRWTYDGSGEPLSERMERAPTLRVADLGTVVLPPNAQVDERIFRQGVIFFRGSASIMLVHPANWPGKEMQGAAYERPGQAIRSVYPDLKDAEAEARARALAWAVNSLRDRERDALITFDEADPKSDQAAPAIRIEGVSLEEGRYFRMRVMEVAFEDR